MKEINKNIEEYAKKHTKSRLQELNELLSSYKYILLLSKNNDYTDFNRRELVLLDKNTEVFKIELHRISELCGNSIGVDFKDWFS